MPDKPNILVTWGDDGLRAEDPTIADLLKDQGYATGQFGKNHLGDRNEFLPTVHGFDEFFGNLYHLNAEEEPELPDYPNEQEYPHFKDRFGPRGVLHCWATDEDDDTEHPRWGRVGKQRIEDTGPLTKKRMETCDDEFVAAAKDWIRRQAEADTPFFCWVNTTHMHLRTHTKPESIGQSGPWQSPYHDTMIDHDKHVGERAFRVPLVVRWPERIAAGVVSNGIVQHHDWLPTFLSMAGDPEVMGKLQDGHEANGKLFEVHIDGYDLLPYLTGAVDTSPRIGFVYFDDDGDLVALRYHNWKMVFMEQRAPGTLRVWAEPLVPLRIPKLYNLRTDPYERADVTSNTYYDWFLDHAYLVLAAQSIVVQFLETFRQFPPRQKPASFTIDQALERMQDAAVGHH